MKRLPILISLASACLPDAGAAADRLLTSADGTIVFRGSYGITAIEANELVYGGKRKLSQLIWQSHAVSTFTGEMTVDLDRFFLRATGTIGTGGDGHMRDYDWLVAGRPWSDRSTHPDTRLNHYFSGSIELDREVLSHDGTTISLGGGVKYTDVKWTAWGGSYVYSLSGFRDDRGDFPANEKGISYRQQWPVPFLGIDLEHKRGDWTFTGGIQGGLAVQGKGTDDHWMRDLRFIDHVDTTPAVMISASAEYEFRPETAFFVTGAFDQIMRGRADTTMIDKVWGGKAKFRNGAGADYMSMTLSLGLRGKF
ncbi:MAG: omptin family outer membrane protease [Rhizobiaceae bacterium]|nr:omptin family outer membrane protease [Rhizobiaceae bacterium]